MGERAQLNSDHVGSVEYDEDARTMKAHFKRGGSYVYHGVSRDVFDGLRNAQSAGQFMRLNVKGVYRHEKI